MSRTIKTRKPCKGDLVVGHKVYAFFADPELPAIRGEVVRAAKSGASVTLDVGEFFSILGLPRRTRWTWRKSVCAYQPAGERTKQGTGLAIAAKGA